MLRALVALILMASFATLLAVHAQQGGTAIYIYDDNGRLRAVIGPTGEANVYEYDAAGNFTAIRRLSAQTVELISFTPHQGVPGDQVTIHGVGFGGGVNSVAFNGTPAQIVSTALATVVVKVPVGATTGPISMTTTFGTAATTTPFVIKGVQVNPTSAVLFPGESKQFQATVFLLGGDLSVEWSVNGIVGGNQFVGTITGSGLYTAPNLPFTSTVRATSNADTSLFGDAPITMKSINNVFGLASTGVAVLREATALPTPTPNVSAISDGLAVLREPTLSPTPTPNVAGISDGLAVLREPNVSPTPTPTTSGISDGLAVLREPIASPNPSPTASGISDGLAVKREPQTSAVPETLTPISSSVSAMTGPYISSMSLPQISRGTSVTLTLSGLNFDGANAIEFFSGAALDSNITATNLVVSPNGATLTATITVNANATVGSHVVVVTATAGKSMIINLGVNTVSIQ